MQVHSPLAHSWRVCHLERESRLQRRLIAYIDDPAQLHTDTCLNSKSNLVSGSGCKSSRHWAFNVKSLCRRKSRHPLGTYFKFFCKHYPIGHMGLVKRSCLLFNIIILLQNDPTVLCQSFYPSNRSCLCLFLFSMFQIMCSKLRVYNWIFALFVIDGQE